MKFHGNFTKRRALLLLNCLLLTVGNCGSPLLLRLYFLRGGKRKWLSSCIQTGGWPIIFLTLSVAYLRRRHVATSTATAPTHLFSIQPPLFLAAALVGVLTGIDNYLFAYGVARLPVSTFSLLIATQLGFTASFAFLLVNQKFSAYSVNAVVLLTVGPAILALHSNSDRPAGESLKEYYRGFVFVVAAAALCGFVLPLVEMLYSKAKQSVSYTVVMEFQVVMCFFATVFSTVGMLIDNDFKVIPEEARRYELGQVKYYVVLAWTAIICQVFFLGAVGVIFYASSLLSGIIIAVLLPVTEILAVIFFHERFQGEKGVALALSLWGFISYFYGELKASKKKNHTRALETELTQAETP